MKLAASFKSHFIYVVALLHIMLYVYAAVTKLLDFENFQVQLGQSPLLSAYAGIVSYAVPVVELVIVGLLFFESTRYFGLYGSLCLMTMFTTYIFIMLHFSPFVPCSCGGILEKMSWQQHLLFNAFFFIINMIAVLLHNNPKTVFLFKKRSTLTGVFLSVVVVVVLFLSSEHTIHHRNNFVRRFPHHPTENKGTIDLQYDSYYLAGYDNGKIYLGNTTAPLVVTVVDTAFQNKQEFTISLKKNDLPFRAPRLVVQDPYFYFTDGTVSCVFGGSITDWKPKLLLYKDAYFSSFVPLDQNQAVIKASAKKTHENVLGVVNYGGAVKLNYDLLQKQIDGIFDTDGMLLYNKQLNKVIHTYYYRNQFIVADPDLKKSFTGTTIDTISKAQLEVVTINSKKITTLAKQPLLVNRKTATYGNYLYVNSALMGKYEPKEMWEKAAVVDVYDLTKKTYAFSFYLYDKGEAKVKDFMVVGDLVVSLVGRYMVVDRIVGKI